MDLMNQVIQNVLYQPKFGIDERVDNAKDNYQNQLASLLMQTGE